VRIEEGLDAEAIASSEEGVVGAVPECKGELAAQPLQAGGTELLVEVQGDLAVGAGAQAVTATLEVALNTLEVVELAVDDNVQGFVLAGDRLITRGQVDDAESGMAQADSPIVGDPPPLPIRSAVGETERCLL
jgi:hypothetical protein